MRLPFNTVATLGLLAGTAGVGGLVFGCTFMVRETRLGLANLAEETEIAALGVDTPILPANRRRELASIFAARRPKQTEANQRKPNGGETPPDFEQDIGIEADSGKEKPHEPHEEQY